MNETKAPKTTARDRSLKTCACAGFYAIETIDGDDRTYGTGCVRQTNNLFAQGHDAKLVSFLVKADLSGDRIYLLADDTEPLGSAEKAAATISQALADKAERALRNALDRLAARVGGKADAIAKAAKATQAKAPKAPKAELVGMGEWIDAKVGRWTYHGTAMENGDFVYETKSGEKKTAAPGTWIKVS